MKSKQSYKRYFGIFFILLLLVVAIFGGQVILPAFASQVDDIAVQDLASVNEPAISLLSSESDSTDKKIEVVHESVGNSLTQNDWAKGWGLSHNFNFDDYVYVLELRHNLVAKCDLKYVFSEYDGRSIQIQISANAGRLTVDLTATDLTGFSRSEKINGTSTLGLNRVFFVTTRSGLAVYLSNSNLEIASKTLFSPNYFENGLTPAAIFTSDGYDNDPFGMFYVGQLRYSSFESSIYSVTGSVYEHIQLLNYLEPIPTPETPHKTGFTFAGWYLGDEEQCDCDGISWANSKCVRYNNEPIYATSDIHPHFTRNQVTIKYVNIVRCDFDGYVGTSTTLSDNKVYCGYNIPLYKLWDGGFDFLGWYFDTGEKYDGTALYTDESVVTLYAYWDIPFPIVCERNNNVFVNLKGCHATFDSMQELFVHECNPVEGVDYFVCEYCGKIFDSLDDLASHIEECHFSCEYCEEVFDSLDDLASHIEECHFVCEYCEEVFDSSGGLASHIEECHKFVCEYCGERFYTSGGLASHIEEHHKFVCGYCFERFYTSDDLASHIEEYHKFFCEYCGERFYTSGELAAHIEECHWLNCHYCDKKFPPDYRDYWDHMWTHDDLDLTCWVCGENFNNYREYFPHVDSHFDDHDNDDSGSHKSYLCFFCGETFDNPFEYDQHVKGIHSSERHCFECGNNFASETEYANHMRQSHGDGDGNGDGSGDGNGDGHGNGNGNGNNGGNNNGGNGSGDGNGEIIGTKPGDGSGDEIVGYKFSFPPSLKNLKNLFDGRFWKALFSGEVEGTGNFIIFALLLLLLIPLVIMAILSIFFPIARTILAAIFKGIGKALLWLLKGLWWLICLPFKGIVALVRKCRGE